MRKDNVFVIILDTTKAIREGFLEKLFLQGFEVKRDLN